ncbi:hypothetical protein FGO68_gene2742 [Halteria grandinella]|uniref:Uncharacterized protein n=1 Tax=Halteria grandinella TaxID=5974 RepID=A0A8J8NRP0_HALGN|nr:hypothetical protein FGO68_gene2742 [Halteria grandinella]
MSFFGQVQSSARNQPSVFGQATTASFSNSQIYAQIIPQSQPQPDSSIIHRVNRVCNLEAGVDSWSLEVPQPKPQIDKRIWIEEESKLDEGRLNRFGALINLNVFIEVSLLFDTNFQFRVLTKLNKISREAMFQNGLRLMRSPLIIVFPHNKECQTSSIEQIYDFSADLTLSIKESEAALNMLGLVALQSNYRDLEYLNFDNFIQYSNFLIELKRPDLKRDLCVNLILNGEAISALFAVVDEEKLEIVMKDLASKQVQLKNLLTYFDKTCRGINHIHFRKLPKVVQQQNQQQRAGPDTLMTQRWVQWKRILSSARHIRVDQFGMQKSIMMVFDYLYCYLEKLEIQNSQVAVGNELFANYRVERTRSLFKNLKSLTFENKTAPPQNQVYQKQIYNIIKIDEQVLGKLENVRIQSILVNQNSQLDVQEVEPFIAQSATFQDHVSDYNLSHICDLLTIIEESMLPNITVTLHIIKLTIKSPSQDHDLHDFKGLIQAFLDQQQKGHTIETITREMKPFSTIFVFMCGGEGKKLRVVYDRYVKGSWIKVEE